MLYLAWDIDGTLLLTNRAGYDALQEAIRDYFYRKEPYEFKHTLAGCTDSSIIKEIVTDIKGRCTSGWAAALMLKYEMYMKRNLKLHKGWLMPNVEKTLQYLSESEPGIANLLLTGNTANGARDKVTEYGIAKYFDFRHSSYGDLAESRDDVAKILYTRLVIDGLINTGETDKIIVIGDTPSDARCAVAIGARCIIVLAGSEFKKEDFVACPPWKMWDKLPDDPADFVKEIYEER
jgi:phosphoglycolate phosphatase-like HAD superfamily hydrolase